MHGDYPNFLDYRAAKRRLAAKFPRPRGLVLQILAFVTTMTLIWTYGLVWGLWFHRLNFALPAIIGVVWSLLLAVQALIHYRRSPAIANRRELAVEDEMRALIEKHGDEVDHHTLFAMHRELETDLERQGHWSVSLLAFTLVNLVSWVASAFNVGTSWPFQTTLPLAVVIVVGVNVFLDWQQRRQAENAGWFARLPLRHLVAYGAGVIGLWLASSLRLINSWDADTLVKGWGIVLLVHLVWAVAVWPVLRKLLPGELPLEQPAKRKSGARLVLTDDGEVLEVEERDAEAFQAGTSQTQTDAL